jgi:PII-like signaling protein
MVDNITNINNTLELLSEIFNEGGIKTISLSNILPIIIYFHSSQTHVLHTTQKIKKMTNAEPTKNRM